MKIFQINTVVSYGSTGRICRDIADVLMEHGHESLIAYGRGDDVEGYQTYKMGHKLDNMYHYAQSFLFNRNGFSSKKATQQLIDRIVEYQPDIIHLHNLHGYYLNIELLFAFLKESKIPVVWLLHDQWSFSGGPANFIFSKQFDAYLATKNEYPKTLSRANYEKMYQLKQEIFSDLPNMTMITPSDWLKKMVEKTFFKQYPVKVFHNGIDLDIFKPVTTDLKNKYELNDKKVLLGVSQVWDSRKGIEFMRELPDLLPDDHQIVMVGVEDKLAGTLSDKVITISHTNNVQELAEWYSVADIFINPTLFDNFPTVNIEAIACGTPVITYDTGGSAESVVEGLTGAVIQRKDEASFVEAITEWPKKSAEIVDACRKQSLNFDKNVMYMKYLDLYRSITHS